MDEKSPDQNIGATTQIAVQLRFDDIESVKRVSDCMTYWLGLPLPPDVTTDSVHQEKYATLMGLRNIFDKCYEAHKRPRGFSVEPQFGKGGSVTQDPPPDK